MYTIHANGELLFSSASEDVESIALSPKLSLDINNSGSVSFILPPGNRHHGGLKKLKSIVTVEQDGTQLARTRVMETETDYYNQQSVYCEGDKAFLLDSLHAPYHYSGTVHGLFRKLIDNHNAMVDSEKQFTIGEITAVGAEETTEVQAESYANTSSEIEDRLLNAYGGYLRTRTVEGIHYIDWVDHYGDENAQPIEFSVNLLDLTDTIDAGDVFTVLIPMGASEIGDGGKYNEPVSIASVNGGLNYIQNDEAVALYGKIWRTQTWSYEDDPAKLLEKAREYLKTGIAIETLTLKAVDMHFVDGKVQPIRLGDRVHIISNPHGLDQVMVCSQIEIDLLNPEKTVYTFGEKPRTLTENFVRAEEEVDQLTGYGGRGGGGGRRSVQQEISDIIRWAQINTNESNAYIQLTAGELDKTKQQLSAAEIDIDGLQAEIVLKASQELVEDTRSRLSFAGIDINGAASEIKLLAKQEVVDELESDVSEAWISIDGKASKVEINALETYIDNLIAGSVKATLLRTANITADGANIGSMSYDGSYITKKSATFLTSDSYVSVSSDGVSITNATLNKRTATIDYLAW